MLYRIKSNAVKIIETDIIKTFPVSISSIHDVIYSKGYEPHQVSGVKEPCIVGGNQLFYPQFETHSECRIALAHELGHIVLHECESYSFLTPAEEWEADVFMLYFTMPPGDFEEDALNHSVWQLAEKYGVPEDYIRLRAAIAEQMVS